MKPLTVSIVEAGRRLGVGRDASYTAARRGEMPVIEIGGRRRVPLAALERLLESGMLPTPLVKPPHSVPAKSAGGRRTKAEPLARHVVDVDAINNEQD